MPARKITARLDSIHKTIAIICCHSLISDATEEGITSFCEEVQSLVGKVSRRSVPLLMGDINAKMGTDNAGRSAAMCCSWADRWELWTSKRHLQQQPPSNRRQFVCLQATSTDNLGLHWQVHQNQINHITTSLTEGLQIDTRSMSFMSLLSDNWLCENETVVERAASLDNNVALCWRLKDNGRFCKAELEESLQVSLGSCRISRSAELSNSWWFKCNIKGFQIILSMIFQDPCKMLQ